jgi:Glycosyltransferase family 87
VTRTLAAPLPAQPALAAGDSGSTIGSWRAPLAVVCGLVLIAATVEIVLDASLEHAPLIPHQPHIATWLQSLGGERLGYRVFLIALLAFTVAYGVLLALVRARGRSGGETAPTSDPAAPGAAPGAGAQALGTEQVSGTEQAPVAERTPARWAIGLVALLNLVVFAGPILISTDVFSYIAYARMGVVHGIDPYLHGPVAIVGDPVFRYVGHDWLRVATAYGPLYTLISYPLGLLGVVGALWGMKLYALIASAVTLALTWRVARRRGHDEVFALLAVGANPLYVIYGLGGAHNDLIMLALMMAAVAFTLSDRDAAAGAAVVAGALVKATVAVLLPFMILARRRLAPALGAIAALALGALAGYAAFGIHGIDIVSALNRDSAFVSTDSFPNELAHLFGKPGVFPVDHDLLKAALVLIVLHLGWRTWRGYDWVAASGWALLAISVTSTWLLAWYILWPLPLAVVTRDRRLLVATLCVQGLFVIHQTAPLWAPVQ